MHTVDVDAPVADGGALAPRPLEGEDALPAAAVAVADVGAVATEEGD